jgi:hypothetical protein
MSQLGAAALGLAGAARLRDVAGVGGHPGLAPEQELIDALRDAAGRLFALEADMQAAGVDMADLACGLLHSSMSPMMNLRRAVRAGCEGRWVAVAREFARQCLPAAPKKRGGK